VKIWLESESNTRHYPYMGNIRYTLQRATGIAALLFIILHLYQLHWMGNLLRPVGAVTFRMEAASYSTAQVIQSARWIVPLYAIGVASACFHFANGIWTFLITWGVTIGPQSQRISGFACAALGVALTITGLTALRGFTIFKIDRAQPASVSGVFQEPRALARAAIWTTDGRLSEQTTWEDWHRAG
jgi:succinate dehydrogenase / fumarate reductase cytochrome b subunit